MTPTAMLTHPSTIDLGRLFNTDLNILDASPDAQDVQDTLDAEELTGRDDESGSTDIIRQYMAEIGRTPLLTAQEEIDLAQAIEAGKLANEELTGSSGELSPADRSELVRMRELGDEARQKLTQANLRLVVSIAKKHIGRGMTLLNLIQEGNLGLMRAVEKFDWRKGNRFSTYATWWIRQAISRALAEQSRLIRLPVHVGESIGQMRRTAERLAIALQREPTSAELATALGISEEILNRQLTAMRQPLSLSLPFGDEGDTELGMHIADATEPDVADTVAQAMMVADLTAALEELPERERRVLTMRYGLDGKGRRTLEQAGVEFGITRERIRQIEADGLRRLRTCEFAGKLLAHLA